MDITTLETQWKQKMNQHIGVDPSRFYLQQDKNEIYLCSSDLYQQHKSPIIMTYHTDTQSFIPSFPESKLGSVMQYSQHLMHDLLYAADCFVQSI